MAKKTFNVGIVGAGLIGQKRAEVVANSKNSKLLAIADINLKKAQDLAKKYRCQATKSWQEIINNKNIDIVIIATPHKFLSPISVSAINHGKHVLCEKPLGRNPEEVEKIVKAAKKAGVKVEAGFNHRYHPAIWKAHKMVNDGKIGKLMYIRCRYGHGGRPGYEKEWRANKELSGGGELLDQGIHAIDLFRWFFGEELSVVSGVTKTFYWNIGVEDNVFCIFSTRSGKVATLHASWTQWKNLFSFEIFGDKGYLIIEGLGGSYGPEKLIWGKRRPESGPPDIKTFRFSKKDSSWKKEWGEFISAIKEDRRPLANAENALATMQIIWSIYSSTN